MAIGSGLGTQFGFKNESTPGTRVAPDHFIRATQQSFKPNKVRAQGQGIQSGVWGPMGDHFVDTNEDANATVEFDVVNKGLGLLFQALMGAAATPTVVSDTAYSQTHTMSDPIGKSLTIQQGVPLRSGAAQCQEINGARALSMEFTLGAGGLLHCVSTWDGHKYDESQALATASYSTNRPFSFKDTTIKTGTFNSEAALSGVRQFTVKIERPMDTADFTFGAAGLKSDPVLNGLGTITGGLTADFTTATKAAIQDLSISNTPTSLVIDALGTAANGWTAISGAVFPEFKIVIPSVYFDADTADPSGPAEITNDYNWTWRYDGTNMPFIYVVSSDSTL